MNVGTEPCVIGQVPADMVRIIIDHYVIGVPKPTVHIRIVPRGNAPEPAVEPEAVAVAAFKPPNMPRAEAAVPVPVLPGMVHVEVGIVAARVVADPHPAVHMRCVRMVGMVAEVTALIAVVVSVAAVLMLVAMIRRRSVGRRLMMALAAVFVLL